MKQLKRIGKGGFGSVYANNRNSVVKVVRKTDIESVKCIQQELEIYRHLKSRQYNHILELKNTINDSQHDGFVMQRGDISLRQLLKHKTVSIDEFKTLIGAILHAIVELHASKVVHSDIKPDNIVIKYDKNAQLKVFLIDFGLSSVEEPDQYKRQGVQGTDRYIDPVLVVQKEMSSYVDIWALSILVLRRLAPSLDYKLLLTDNLQELTQIENWTFIFDKLIQDRIKHVQDYQLKEFLMFTLTVQKDKRHSSQQVLNYYQKHVKQVDTRQMEKIRFTQLEFPVFTYLTIKKNMLLVYVTEQQLVIRSQQKQKDQQEYSFVAVNKEGFLYFNNGSFLNSHQVFLKETAQRYNFPTKLKQKQFEICHIKGIKQTEHGTIMFFATQKDQEFKYEFNIKMQHGIAETDRFKYMYSNEFIFPISINDTFN